MEHQHDTRQHGKKLLVLIAALIGWGIAVLWSWNTFAVELLSQPTMEFRHALALELFVLSVASVFPITQRFLDGQAS